MAQAGRPLRRLYDCLRIDHFRGLDRYWSVPAGAETAREGHWEPGPGLQLVEVLKQAAGSMELVAEDLGILDDRALAFFAASGLPGMSVLVYAFSPDGKSAYLPHNCPPNKVIYTATHDCPTFLQWLVEEASPEEKQFATDYLDLRLEDGLTWGALRGAWGSPCALAIAPLQDILGLGADARTNLPGHQRTGKLVLAGAGRGSQRRRRPAPAPSDPGIWTVTD